MRPLLRTHKKLLPGSFFTTLSGGRHWTDLVPRSRTCFVTEAEETACCQFYAFTVNPVPACIVVEAYDHLPNEKHYDVRNCQKKKKKVNAKGLVYTEPEELVHETKPCFPSFM